MNSKLLVFYVFTSCFFLGLKLNGQQVESNLFLSTGWDLSTNLLAGKSKFTNSLVYSAGFQLHKKDGGSGFEISHQRNYRTSVFHWQNAGDVKQFEIYNCTNFGYINSIKIKKIYLVPGLGLTSLFGSVNTTSTDSLLNSFVSQKYQYNAAVRLYVNLQLKYSISRNFFLGISYFQIFRQPVQYHYIQHSAFFNLYYKI